jgi:MFS family permease
MRIATSGDRDTCGVPIRSRLLRVLIAAQVLGGLGQAAGGAAGALLARDVAGTDAAAGLPLSLVVAGSALAAIPISGLSRSAGRRPGLATALVAGAAGAGLCVWAGAIENLPLLLVGCLLFGAGNTAVMLARYAAADLSEPERRARTIGMVVFATTFGAVAGPNLLDPAGAAAGSAGLPPLTGLFVLAALAYMAAAAVLLTLLRPDPLRLATHDEPPEDAWGPRPPLAELLTPPAVRAGLGTIVTANLVMVAVMAMTPVHMRHHDHSLTLVGFVISLHIAGMFAPAPITGRLADRFGARRVALGGCATLLAAGALAGAAGGAVPVLSAGLLLLGVGWNACLIAGSALLVSAVAVGQRPRVEGVGELSMGIAAAAGGALAGPAVAVASYPALAVTAAALAATVAPVLLVSATRGSPAPVAPRTPPV